MMELEKLNSLLPISVHVVLPKHVVAKIFRIPCDDDNDDDDDDDNGDNGDDDDNDNDGNDEIIIEDAIAKKNKLF